MGINGKNNQDELLGFGDETERHKALSEFLESIDSDNITDDLGETIRKIVIEETLWQERRQAIKRGEVELDDEVDKEWIQQVADFMRVLGADLDTIFISACEQKTVFYKPQKDLCCLIEGELFFEDDKVGFIVLSTKDHEGELNLATFDLIGTRTKSSYEKLKSNQKGNYPIYLPEEWIGKNTKFSRFEIKISPKKRFLIECTIKECYENPEFDMAELSKEKSFDIFCTKMDAENLVKLEYKINIRFESDKVE